MSTQNTIRRAPWLLMFGFSLILLAGMDYSRHLLKRAVLKIQKPAWTDLLEESTQTASDEKELKRMREKDLLRFKKNLLGLTRSRRNAYEWGLALQEENRLLEKQWEIMSTYLLLDPSNKTIHLMREGQSLETYPIAYAPPKAFGEEAASIPVPTRIVSKERFARPKEGKVEDVNGELVWNPPQVGSSRRANALGEYVLFARGHLIFHGPALKKTEHEAYPHYCLGLSLHAARELYAHTFIGTKIIIAPISTTPKKKFKRLSRRKRHLLKKRRRNRVKARN